MEGHKVDIRFNFVWVNVTHHKSWCVHVNLNGRSKPSSWNKLILVWYDCKCLYYCEYYVTAPNNNTKSETESSAKCHGTKCHQHKHTHTHTCATEQIHSEKCQQCGSSVVYTFSSMSTLRTSNSCNFTLRQMRIAGQQRRQWTLYLMYMNSHCTDHWNNNRR